MLRFSNRSDFETLFKLEGFGVGYECSQGLFDQFFTWSQLKDSELEMFLVRVFHQVIIRAEKMGKDYATGFQDSMSLTQAVSCRLQVRQQIERVPGNYDRIKNLFEPQMAHIHFTPWSVSWAVMESEHFPADIYATYFNAFLMQELSYQPGSTAKLQYA